MTSRRLMIAANWKMNGPPAGWDSADSPFRPRKDIDVVVFPTFLDLQRCMAEGLIVGAQTGYPDEKGPHTGDVSMKMIKDAGAQFVLCGHSERRQHHSETDEYVTTQASAALKAGLLPIVCVGETIEERTAGHAQTVVQRQIHPLPSGIVIAYEPVWAIGTGKTPTAKEAQEMHAFIRSLLPGSSQESTRILYGGSMNPGNAEELLAQADIDGGLIGTAALKTADFSAIIEIAQKMSV